MNDFLVFSHHYIMSYVPRKCNFHSLFINMILVTLKGPLLQFCIRMSTFPTILAFLAHYVSLNNVL